MEKYGRDESINLLESILSDFLGEPEEFFEYFKNVINQKKKEKAISLCEKLFEITVNKDWCEGFSFVEPDTIIGNVNDPDYKKNLEDLFSFLPKDLKYEVRVVGKCYLQ